MLAETSDEDENGNHRPRLSKPLGGAGVPLTIRFGGKAAKSLTAPAYVPPGAGLLAEDGSNNGVA